MGLNKPYPSKAVVVGNYRKYIYTVLPENWVLYMHQRTYNGQFYTARMAAVSGFQNLLNNIDIHKTRMGCGPRDGHYCKTNCLHGNNLFIISNNAV